ncbi:heme exporter protein CcmD [Castellaniella sp.]|uniref:heme exporter protein CcmD n=1 Tax=Castellaniella sp. TaxID=1955812 RepID=UPI00355EF37A
MSGYSLQQLWSLNGHGIYVWGSLALCALAVLVEWQSLRQARRHALQRVRRLQRNKERTAT